MRAKPVGLLVVCLLVAAAVQAADCTQTGNLVSNCGFDTDLSDWAIGAADSSAHIPDDGGFALGSAELDRHDGINAIEIISSCIEVAQDTSYNVGVAFRLVSGSVSSTCTLDIWQYELTACNDFAPVLSTGFLPTATWSEIFGEILTGTGINSITLRLACSSEDSDFIIRLDDFLFGEDLFSPVVFNDGFEAEETLLWTSQSP